MKRIYFLPIFLLSTLFSIAQTELPPFAFGVVDGFYSNELGEHRTLNIYLPPGYHPDSATRYPVIYLLDGSALEDYAHTAGLVEFLSTYGVIPQSIVVGIANVSRRRDFTHPTTVKEDLELIPNSGGSEKFMAFIEKELQPYIDSHYLTNADKMLIGQSLGGLLATEIFIKKTDLFNRYVIVSPSLWWDKESLLSQVPAFLKEHSDLKQQVCIAVGKEPVPMNRDVNTLVKYLKKYPSKSFSYNYVYLPDEDHGTILHMALYKAFEGFYKGKSE